MESSLESQTKTVPMLKDELRVLTEFMRTTVYQDYRKEAKAEKDGAIEQVLGAAPATFGDLVSREQALGAGRVAETFLTWFDDQVATLKSLIKEREAPALDTQYQ